jgi:ketosteroid isomerase-like protein
MRTAPFALFTSATLLIAACNAPEHHTHTHGPAFDPGAVKAVLDSMNTHYDERFRQNDAAWFAQRHTAQSCVMAPDMPRICGLDGVRSYYWNNGDNQTLQLTVTGEEVSGTAQEVTEIGNYLVRDDEGTELDKGKFIATYRFEDGRWKVHRELWNSDGREEAAEDSTATGV